MPVHLLARVLLKVLPTNGLPRWWPWQTRKKAHNLYSYLVSNTADGPHLNHQAAVRDHHRRHAPWMPSPSHLLASGMSVLDRYRSRPIRSRTMSPFAGLLPCSPHVTPVLQIHFLTRMRMPRTLDLSTHSPLVNFQHRISESCSSNQQLYKQVLLPLKDVL